VLTSRKTVRTMIETSPTWQEADKILDEFTPCTTIQEKLCFLYGMFDVSIIDPGAVCGDYQALLAGIIYA